MNAMNHAAEPGIASLIAAADKGDGPARDTLFAGLYEELHRLARRQLAGRGVPVTLSPTTLIHEAYLDMTGREGLAFPDRSRFMGYAARVMRGLIIDYARNRTAQKRGGRIEITSIKTDIAEQPADDNELLRIGDALDELAKIDVALAEIVDLKFFCGFSVGEIAAMRGVSERTVQRSWEKARAYLHRGIRQSPVD
jgi:RNA polymerase sigma factor (TIGR02999 family)